MKAYIIQSDKKIKPFGEHPQDCLIGNRRLSAWQKSILLKQGFEPNFISSAAKIRSGEECIFFNDNTYFTPELLLEFVAKSRQQRSNTICALKKSIFTSRAGIEVQDVENCGEWIQYGLRYSPRGGFEEKCVPIIIDPDRLPGTVFIPKHMCGSEKGYEIPLTMKVVVQINHWINLWAANISLLLTEFARIQKMPKIKLVLFALRARSLNKWKILSALNKVGQGCDIHPTASIEASTIGHNVTIGAGAIIRGSIIGNNVFIGNGVVVEYSVIGNKSSILNGPVMYCVFYPETFSSTTISASIVGRESFLGVNTTLTDFRFDKRNVSVVNDGTIVDSGNLFLGSCLGHRVYLGSGCVIAPGRVIPNGSRIILPEERIFRGCASDKTGFRIINEI